jgi:ribose 5-phosphate isomerase B
MKISIGSDHAGFDLKLKLKEYIKSINFEIIDRGTYSNESCDYPDYAHLVSYDVLNKESRFGILICGSGNGINMTANKWQDIRSALCWNKEIAELARLHNDANILTLPARYISIEEAIECINKFINTEFEGGRHQNRINKINLQK